MVILVLLVILWTPSLMAKLGGFRARTPARAHSPRACAAPPSGAQMQTGSDEWPVWSALDDRQLTRLLTNSAPRTITE